MNEGRLRTQFTGNLLLVLTLSPANAQIQKDLLLFSPAVVQRTGR